MACERCSTPPFCDTCLKDCMDRQGKHLVVGSVLLPQDTDAYALAGGRGHSRAASLCGPHPPPLHRLARFQVGHILSNPDQLGRARGLCHESTRFRTCQVLKEPHQLPGYYMSASLRGHNDAIMIVTLQISRMTRGIKKPTAWTKQADSGGMEQSIVGPGALLWESRWIRGQD